MIIHFFHSSLFHDLDGPFFSTPTLEKPAGGYWELSCWKLLGEASFQPLLLPPHSEPVLHKDEVIAMLPNSDEQSQETFPCHVHPLCSVSALNTQDKTLLCCYAHAVFDRCWSTWYTCCERMSSCCSEILLPKFLPSSAQFSKILILTHAYITSFILFNLQQPRNFNHWNLMLLE